MVANSVVQIQNPFWKSSRLPVLDKRIRGPLVSGSAKLAIRGSAFDKESVRTDSCLPISAGGSWGPVPFSLRTFGSGTAAQLGVRVSARGPSAVRLGALRRQLHLSVPRARFPQPGSANPPGCWVGSTYEAGSLISRDLHRQQVVFSGLGRQWLPENEVSLEPTFKQRPTEGLCRDLLKSRLWEAAEASRQTDERSAAA